VLFNLAVHDINAGHGVAVVDPRDDLADAIIDALPASRTHHVCYLNVAHQEFPVGFNPLASVPADRGTRSPRRASFRRSGICGMIPGDRVSNISSSTVSRHPSLRTFGTI
jgi:hypothetical protein